MRDLALVLGPTGRSDGSRKDTTDGIIGEPDSGSGMQSIWPTPFAGAWTHITLLVVPRSIPATLALPRKPI